MPRQTLYTVYSLLLAHSGYVRALFCNRFFYLSVPSVREAPMQTGEIVMDICGIGGIFLSRSYFLGNAPAKTQNFIIGPVGFSTSPNSDMLKGRLGKLLHIYVQCGLV